VSRRQRKNARTGIRRLGLMIMIVSALAAVLGGCAVSYTNTPLPSPSQPSTAPTPSPSGSSSSPAPAPCTNATASYAPSGRQPGAGGMPNGSTMAAIAKRGRLIAGVSADTFLLGSRNPIDGRIEGFDIDMVNMIAASIFGTATGHVELRVITASDRIPVLAKHQVDVVVRAFSITCDRWKQIAFSSEYYHAGQKLMVAKSSPIKSYHDLAGKRVCAPLGTSTITQITKLAPTAKIVGAATHTGCLVLFQQGKVDVITGDDTVLAGLAAQDPYAQVVAGRAFTVEPYGIGIAPDQTDFVRFVNGALQKMRSDGQWTASYNRWLASSLGKAPAPPVAVYGR